MITKEQQFLLDALRLALHSKTGDLSALESASLETHTVVELIQKHGILPTVFPVLSGFPEIRNALRGAYYTAVGQIVMQDLEGAGILRGLDHAGLDCIALKGWVMRRLYPERKMRGMSDLDILVRPYDFSTICEVMRDLEYSVPPKDGPWKHDNFSKDVVKVEMHKRLSDDNGAIRNWEAQMWERAKPSGEGAHILCMSDEDYFLFHLIHMHKDFLNGSLGLRRIADTWLILHTHPAMDQAYLRDCLQKMQLSSFAERMTNLSMAVMGDAPLDENSEILLEYAFQSGIFGAKNSYQLGRIAAMSHGSLRSGKYRSLLAAVFLPYGRMAAAYPKLRRWPFLLPWYWGVRIGHYLRGDWKKNRQRLDYSGVNEADFRRIKRAFKAGGVER